MARRFSGDRLTQLRTNAGLRREHVAVAVDRSVFAVRSYERGDVCPPADVLAALADVLGCRVDDLFVAADAARGA